MTAMNRGNADHLSVFNDNSFWDIIILGNGMNDTVSVNESRYRHNHYGKRCRRHRKR